MLLSAMRAYFCGTRGCMPVSSAEHLHYGGHTSCIGLAHSGEPPTIVLDAGTGLQQLSRMLRGRAFRGTLLLGRLHSDRAHGMPSSAAARSLAAGSTSTCPSRGWKRKNSGAAISPAHFPIRPKQFGDRWTFDAIVPGRHEFERFSVDALEIPHKGGRTFGYRVSDGSGTLSTFQITTDLPRSRPGRHRRLSRRGHHADRGRRPARARFPARGGRAVGGWIFRSLGGSVAAALAHRANARRFVLFHRDRGVPMPKSTPWSRGARRHPSAFSQPTMASS